MKDQIKGCLYKHSIFKCIKKATAQTTEVRKAVCPNKLDVRDTGTAAVPLGYLLLKHHVVVRAGESPCAQLILGANFSFGLHSVPLNCFIFKNTTILPDIREIRERLLQFQESLPVVVGDFL